jgi:hypothetical protein
VVWARAGRDYFVTQREADKIRGSGAADRNGGPTEGKQHAPSFISVLERQLITLFYRKGSKVRAIELASRLLDKPS